MIYLNINLSKEEDIGIEYEDNLSEDYIIELFHNNIEEDTCMKFVQF